MCQAVSAVARQAKAAGMPGPCAFGFRVFRVEGLGFRVFRVFRVEGLGLRV